MKLLPFSLHALVFCLALLSPIQVFAIDAAQIFQAGVRYSPVERTLLKLPLRENGRRALNELYSNKRSAAKLRWNNINRRKVGTEFRSALATHGLSVLHPLSNPFLESQFQRPLGQEDQIILSALLINILDRFIHGHLSHQTLGRKVNQRDRINAIKQATLRFLETPSPRYIFSSLQPGWQLYSSALSALREAKGLAVALERMNHPELLKFGYCSNDLNVYSKVFALFELRDFKKMTEVKVRGKKRRIFLNARQGTSRELPPLGRSLTCFDEGIYQAVQLFQHRVSLPMTGEIDTATNKEIKRVIRDWKNTLRINLDRMRWVPFPKSGPMVLVNIPAFQLFGFRDGTQELFSKVVVGERMNHTPLFEDSIEYVVFHPAWWVPKSIAQTELVEEVLKDPLYFEKYGFTANLNNRPISGAALALHARKIGGPPVPGVSMSQRSGPHNVLGKVKFIFPNSNNIYLHDTPDEHLFEKEHRTLSHGCIRVEKPEQLAVFALNGHPQYSSQKAIQQRMESGMSKKVNVKRQIPISIVYWTIKLNRDGRVVYADDVYQYDKETIRMFHER